MPNAMDIAAFGQAKIHFPLKTRVLGTPALAAALGPGRVRDMTTMGTVIGYDDRRLRLEILWDNAPPEFLAPKYLEPVGG